MIYSNQLIKDLGKEIEICGRDEFFNCVFEGELPKFRYCYFSDCSFIELKIKEFLHCHLYGCVLNRSDFSNADVSFSTTHESAPTQAIGCRWDGMRQVLNCGWSQGIDIGDGDENLLYIAMAMIPLSKNKEEIYKLLPKTMREKIRILLKKPIRKI